MATDPRRLYDAKDMEGAILYVKRVTGSDDAYPLLANADGSLIVSLTSGTVSIDTAGLATGLPDNSAYSGAVTYGTVIMGVRQDTPVTNFDGAVGAVRMSLKRELFTQIRDAAGNDRGVNVGADGSLQISGSVNIATATLGTVTITGTVTPSTTASTITNAVGNPVNVALTSTEVTVKSAVAGFNVNIATATLGTVTITGTVTPSTTASTVTNSVSTIAIVGRTLTGSTGSLTATNGVITLTPTNRIKVYAISLTTTSATELICVLNSGGVANGLELWRATLMAPAGASAGLNLAVAPPNFLFASRSGTAVSLSLNTATLVHYSVSYFDEI